MQLINWITALSLVYLVASDPLQTRADDSLPNHFGLFMYSIDGTIVNETLYARSRPCIKNTTAGVSTVRDDPEFGTYGSYTWGIGPHGHLFAHNDGRIATCSPTCIGGHDFFGGTSQVLVQSWPVYYNRTTRPPIPICGVQKSTCDGSFSLQCESEGYPLTWSFCGSEIDSAGKNYTLDVLSWSTIVAPGCFEVKVKVVEEPKNWGNQTYSHTGVYKDCKSFQGK